VTFREKHMATVSAPIVAVPSGTTHRSRSPRQGRERPRSRCWHRNASASCASIGSIAECHTKERRPARGGVREDDDGSVDHRQ
jgi:hypothetical protein